MRLPLLNRRTASILLVVAMALTGLSCGKQRTQFSLNKAKDLKNKIQEYEGEKHDPPAFKELEDLINKAENAMNQKNYAESVPLAGQAVDKARDLRDRVRVKQSTTLRDRANGDMTVVRANDGAKLDAAKYNEIDAKLQQMDQKFGEGKHDDVIVLSNEIHRLTEELLEPLRQQAETGSREVATRVEDMNREQVPQYASTFMTEVQKLQSEISKLIKEERKYKEAIAQIDQAKTKATQGVTEAQKARSLEKLKAVEFGLGQAHQLGAGKLFAVEAEKQCSERYSALLEKHFNEEYSVVLENVDLLQQNVDQLILQTKREAAAAAVKRLEGILVSLVDGHARDYPDLSGSVDEIEKLLKDAQEAFKTASAASYDEVQKTCSTAEQKADSVNKRFENLAADHIRAAENALGEAQSVFGRAKEDGFFIPKPDDKVLPVDQPFEKSKEALFAQIGKTLEDIQREIEVATTRRGEKKHHNAIVISDTAKASAQDNMNEVYHVAAHNTLVELAYKAREVEQDGAGEYAKAELGEAQKQIGEAREIIVGGKYREALDKAADARASLENAVAALHQVALTLINDAKDALRKAEKEGVAQSRPDKTKLAQSLVTQASESLGVSPPTPLESSKIIYKRAIEQAKEAQTIIAAMRSEKGSEECLDAINLAQAAIQKATDAGASVYAATAISDAQARLSQAQSLQKEGQYVDGRAAAEQARQLAADAMFQQVNEADDAIANARLYRGWDFKQDLLAQAIVNSKKARVAIGEGRYDEGHLLAQAAMTAAKAITRFSRERDFVLRVRDMKNVISASLLTGSGFFQPKELREMIEELYNLEETFTPEKYDGYNQRLAKLQGRIEYTVNNTPEALRKLLEQRMNYLEDLERLGAKKTSPYELEMARRAFNQADMDYKAQRYAKSYEMVLRGVRLSSVIVDDLGAAGFTKDASQIVQDLSGAMYAFRGFLNLTPSQLIPLTTGFNAKGQVISITGTRPGTVWYWENGVRKVLSKEQSIDPVVFSDRVADIYARALTIQAPESQKPVYHRLIEACRNAAEAGRTFQKFLIIDQFSEKQRHEIIQTAYTYVEKSKADQAFVRDKVLKPEQRRVDTYQRPVEKMLPQR